LYGKINDSESNVCKHSRKLNLT